MVGFISFLNNLLVFFFLFAASALGVALPPLFPREMREGTAVSLHLSVTTKNVTLEDSCAQELRYVGFLEKAVRLHGFLSQGENCTCLSEMVFGGDTLDMLYLPSNRDNILLVKVKHERGPSPGSILAALPQRGRSHPLQTRGTPCQA